MIKQMPLSEDDTHKYTTFTEPYITRSY